LNGIFPCLQFSVTWIIADNPANQRNCASPGEERIWCCSVWWCWSVCLQLCVLSLTSLCCQAWHQISVCTCPSVYKGGWGNSDAVYYICFGGIGIYLIHSWCIWFLWKTMGLVYRFLYFIIIHFAILSSAVVICPVMKSITPKLQWYMENCVFIHFKICVMDLIISASRWIRLILVCLAMSIDVNCQNCLIPLHLYFKRALPMFWNFNESFYWGNLFDLVLSMLIFTLVTSHRSSRPLNILGLYTITDSNKRWLFNFFPFLFGKFNLQTLIIRN